MENLKNSNENKIEKKEIEEKKESVEKTENCVMDERSGLPQELQNFKKICSSRCAICNSGLLVEIHKMKQDGLRLQAIVDLVLKEHGATISTASLSRHFQGYAKFKLKMATEIIQNDTINEITAQSVHLKKTVELLDLAYDKLIVMFKSDTYNIDISDLEKLAKIRYQVLAGDNLDENGLTAIFQKATNKYGLNLQQGVLFGNK